MYFKLTSAVAILLTLGACSSTQVPQPIPSQTFFTHPGTPASSSAAPQIVQPLPDPGEVTVEDVDKGRSDPALAMVEEDPVASGAVATRDPNAETVIASGTDSVSQRLPDTCKLERYQYLQGQGENAVNDASLTIPHRVIAPSDIITQEYNPARVNFYLDGSGRIARITCG